MVSFIALTQHQTGHKRPDPDGLKSRATSNPGKPILFRHKTCSYPKTMENHPQHLPDLPEPFLMIAVPGGRFNMGGKSWDNESSLPVHPVEVDDFWMGQYPVTQALWTAVMGAENNPAHFKGPARPVETISWDMIDQEFLPRLKKLTLDSRPSGTAYRLPTEAEWEYAARGGATDQPTKYAGSNRLDEVGWYDNNSHGETKPVGLKLPNELGICDMSGNVWEWCEDQWHDTYEGAPDDGSAWVDREQGALRVCRGGSWFINAQFCRTTPRYHITPARRYYYIGFRLVLSALPV
jgi:formylglycine-generating enzyme required for sulfatase activity